MVLALPDRFADSKPEPLNARPVKSEQPVRVAVSTAFSACAS